MSRTDFEAAYIERYGHRPRGWSDDFQVYQDAHANGAWFGWQAGAAGIEAKAAPAQLAQQQVPGWKLVPVEPTPEMVSAAEEAHMPFGDMDIALRMAILSAPSTPATVQGDGWIPIIERLPQIKQVLSEKCTLEGREIPTLYRSGMVLTFDGSRVSAGIVEWFHSKSPLNNVTHWMPLPPAPARQEGGKV